MLKHPINSIYHGHNHDFRVLLLLVITSRWLAATPIGHNW